MLNQIGFANMAKSMTYALDYLRDGKMHAIASVTSTPFDIFVYEIFVSLTHGLKVVMANNNEHRNPKLLDSLIRKHGVDVMTVTPSLMKINYDNREKDTALARVKNMVFGGEPLPQKFVDDLRALSSDITIFNIYGPSEITILCNVQNLNGEEAVMFGKASYAPLESIIKYLEAISDRSKEKYHMWNTFGIPRSGYFIGNQWVQVKDSSRGAEYSKVCIEKCPYYDSCNEGLFSPFISVGEILHLSGCKNKDLYYTLKGKSEAEIKKALDEILTLFENTELRKH